MAIVHRQAAGDFVLEGFFVGYYSFFHQLQLASHDISAIWQKKWWKTKFQIHLVHV